LLMERARDIDKTNGEKKGFEKAHGVDSRLSYARFFSFTQPA